MTNLKNIRDNAGLSQSQLSDRSGFNVRMIQYYEQGVKEINKAQAITLFKLAQALGCNMEDLIETDIERKEKLANKDLADIFYYCAELARLVSPNDAKRYYGFNFDGSVCDTLRELGSVYYENKDINSFKDDVLYGSVFDQMISDINDLYGE